MSSVPSKAPVSSASVSSQAVLEVQPRRILVVEDNEIARKQVQLLLQADPGLLVDTAANGSEALDLLGQRTYSIVVTDLKMPRVSGMELLEEVQKRNLPVAVIVTTGFGSIDQAVQAMRLGATDFLTKPLNFDHLRLVLQRALRERSLQDEVIALREKLQERFSFQNVLSKSPRMHAVFELIGHVSQTATTVLIEGETGTGKELIARAIHAASTRNSGPFVPVNCAALPENLLESELFGHEKGSFTNAIAQRKGRFELAHGGTIFLDEIGEVPLPMQAKLLRVLQEKCFERVGGMTPIEVDVRVVAATNRNLKKMTAEGKFREDLYYRLNVIKIELPTLSDRPEDIPLLTAHFAQKFSRPGTNPKQIAPEAMEILLQYNWPGNIRELENVMERACVTSPGDTITIDHLPPELAKPVAVKMPFTIDLSRPMTDQLAEITASFEERYLRRALKKARGHIGRTARITGLSRRTITDKIAHYKIDKTEFKRSEKQQG